MKHMVLILISILMICSASLSEEASPYPFDIPANATMTEVRECVSAIFGEWEVDVDPDVTEESWYCML